GWMRHKVFEQDNKDEEGNPIRQKELDGSPNPVYYLEGDSVGATGMERAAEKTLRGLRGTRTTKLDTGEKLERSPAPGKDVQLTIDALVQAEVQALLSNDLGLTTVQPWQTNRHPGEPWPEGVPQVGEPLAASAVVIEVGTGDIIALATSPTFLPQD